MKSRIFLTTTETDCCRRGADFHPKAPGMKYKHYAPRAEMIIFSGEREKVKLAMAEEKMRRAAQGQKVEVIVYDDAETETAAHRFLCKAESL